MTSPKKSRQVERPPPVGQTDQQRKRERTESETEELLNWYKEFKAGIDNNALFKTKRLLMTNVFRRIRCVRCKHKGKG